MFLLYPDFHAGMCHVPGASDLRQNIEHLLFRFLPILAPAARFVISLRFLFALTVFLLTFMDFLPIVPHKTKPRQQLPGAAFTAVGWLVFSYAFLFILHISAIFPYMYGSLTAIVLLMLWLYICICILFIGAEQTVS